MLKVLIADDDFGMRRVLRKVICKKEEFELVGEAENGIVAVEMFEDYSPDVVFLDIEMPELGGIECARKIFDINPKTIIIFATAHEGFMSQAFEVYAFDYLMKPFDLERLYKTLDRVIEAKDSSMDSEVNRIDHDKKCAEKLVVKNKDGISFIDCEEIVVVQREDRSTVIYTSKQKYITSEPLSNIQERLDDDIFMRSHKSYIINTKKITNIYPYGRWTYIVKFNSSNVDALITHKKFDELEKKFIV